MPIHSKIEALFYTLWEDKGVLLPPPWQNEIDFYDTMYTRVKADVLRLTRISEIEIDVLRNWTLERAMEIINEYI